MASTWERIQQVFVDDHRSMMRGYRDLIALLKDRNFDEAAQAASQLDSLAGPHIEFEEKYLYPQVAKSRGDAHMSRLYDEHDVVLTVLVALEMLPHRDSPDEETLQKWISQLQLGIDHASACGNLLIELKSLSEDEQLRFLDGLTRLQEQGTRWTQLQFSSSD